MTALQIIGLVLLIIGLLFFVMLIVVSAISKSNKPPMQEGKKNLYFIGGVPFYTKR